MALLAARRLGLGTFPRPARPHPTIAAGHVLQRATPRLTLHELPRTHRRPSSFVIGSVGPLVFGFAAA